jgi:hypothetical protein
MKFLKSPSAATCVILALSLLNFSQFEVQADPFPQVPSGGQWFDTTGKPITPDDFPQTKGQPVNGLAPMKIPLQGVTAGAYNVSLVVDSGFTDDPYGQAGTFVLAQEGPDGKLLDYGPMRAPSDTSLTTVLENPNGNVPVRRGYVEASQPVFLGPDKPLFIRYASGGSSIVAAVRIEPIEKPCGAIALDVNTGGAIDNAFYDGKLPQIKIMATNASDKPWQGFIRVERLDLLTNTSTTDFVDCSLDASEQKEIPYTFKDAFYGVYRMTVRAADGKDDSQASSTFAYVTLAYSPAKLAKDLPDDWPMATHHSNPSPVLHAPMPGFKWYRCFISWPDLNPAKGTYNWKDLDATMDDIQKVGGKMLLAFEGTPSWANSSHDTKKAPDNFDDYRTFLHDLVDRYDNKSPLGAIEVWNEPNANIRWYDTLDKLVEMHKITFEETRRTQGRIKTVGLTISGGYHPDYVDQLEALGIFNYIDIAAEHFYEEIGNYNRLDLRNNFPIKVDQLRLPMLREKIYRPIWDTESGMGWEDSNGKPRPGGKMMSQREWVEQLKARKDYKADEPWQMWAGASEPRMAEEVVTGMVSELANDVEMHFTFHPNWYSLDNALNLPWVANGCLGEVLLQVDFHYVMPVAINAVGGADNIGALAYRIGKPGQKQVVVVWAEQVMVKHPFPAPYTPQIDPVPVQVPCAAGTEVTVQDMYLRTSTKVKSATYPGGDAVTINVGEQPVYIWDWKPRDQ